MRQCIRCGHEMTMKKGLGAVAYTEKIYPEFERIEYLFTKMFFCSKCGYIEFTVYDDADIQQKWNPQSCT